MTLRYSISVKVTQEILLTVGDFKVWNKETSFLNIILSYPITVREKESSIDTKNNQPGARSNFEIRVLIVKSSCDASVKFITTLRLLSTLLYYLKVLLNTGTVCEF